MPRDRCSDGDGQHARGDRPDDRNDLDHAGKGPDQDEVRLPDGPEPERQHRADEHDQERLSPHEGAELEVDQVPRIAELLSLRPW